MSALFFVLANLLLHLIIFCMAICQYSTDSNKEKAFEHCPEGEFTCLGVVFMVAAKAMFTTDIAASITKITVAFIPMLLGMVCHEVAHGWVAYKLGDPTAKSQGRLTLNPTPHIDPMGTLMFILTALTSPFIIGWAKPVPVDTRWFKNQRQGIIMVSAAGPITNFILAVLFALGYSATIYNIPEPGSVYASVHTFLSQMCQYGVMINLTLGWFNLMPLPPLDGSNIVAGILPAPSLIQIRSLSRYGFIIVILLLATGFLGAIIRPLIMYSVDLINLLLSLF